MARSHRRLALLLSALAGLALPAFGAGPVLHEFIVADPSEDLALHATTPDGRMPAAIQTPQGVIAAPDPRQSPYTGQNAYGGSATPSSADSTYRIDRDTTQPDLVSYDDPFIPTVTPFKRLYAFDAVDEDLELVVQNRTLAPLPASGQAPQSGEEAFFADIVVDLVENTPVRIPSVGPGARVVSAVINPKTRFELLYDSAENWFVKAAEKKRVRLIMQLAAPRAAFGSEFADVTFATLRRHVAPLPASVRPVARRVLDELGVDRGLTPRAAVAALVGYFRGFAPSEQLPAAALGPELYLELSLSRKGVCRHRAYAFMITALEAGIPARFVHNEAHAWVEVHDGTLWHRIDLGGAAQRMDAAEQNSALHHTPPNDPYAWPEGSQSGQQLAQESQLGSPGGGGAAAPASSGGGDVPAPGTAPSAQPIPPSEADERPSSEITLELGSREVRRGEPLAVSGRVSAHGEQCSYLRVDLALRTPSGSLIPMQPLPTQADGRFSGRVIVPIHGVDVGEYDVVASTPGNAHCGPGQGE